MLSLAEIVCLHGTLRVQQVLLNPWNEPLGARHAVFGGCSISKCFVRFVVDTTFINPHYVSDLLALPCFSPTSMSSKSLNFGECVPSHNEPQAYFCFVL